MLRNFTEKLGVKLPKFTIGNTKVRVSPLDNSWAGSKPRRTSTTAAES